MSNPHPLLKKRAIFVADITVENETSEYRKGKGWRNVWKKIIRFTRETRTQLIAEGQYVFDCNEGDEPTYSRRKYNYKRFDKKGEGLEGLRLRYDHNWNENEPFSLLPFSPEHFQCEIPYSNLFQTPILNLRLSKRALEQIERRKGKPSLEVLPNETLEDYMELSESANPATGPMADVMNWDIDIVRHLEELFDLPIYILDVPITWDRHHGTDDLGSSFISYEIECFGDDKKVINFKENYSNRKVFLWIYEDRVICAHEA